jgi:secreted trypsin-like serine protease
MRRNTALTALGAVACLLGGAAVWAITFGEPDNGRHPFVGSVVAEFGGEKFQFCSGTLVSPTGFVTAAHCLFGTEEEGIPIWVTFDEIIDANADGLIDAGVTLHTGTAVVHPLFPGAPNDPHDVAVFVLDEPVSMPVYGELPTLGLLDSIDKRSTLFTPVGYGTVRNDKRKAFKSFELGTRRLVAVQEALSLNKAWLELSMNPSTGNGGTCYGDSGGPHFLGAGSSETTTIVSLTVTGDRFCRATDKTYRLDTASALSFLSEFVSIP